ncbi:glycosyltransferase [Clostridium sp. VAP51]|uniref:glycosyltransferase n=1 Tax=Clostridium sp. VAP51 TaxID=2949978 RepID=UPI002079491C|nr:glycosyltransferase [Clostridium sp. VAP51]
MKCINCLSNKIVNSDTVMCTIYDKKDINIALKLATEFSINNLFIIGTNNKILDNMCKKLKESKLSILINNIKLIYNHKNKYIDLNTNEEMEYVSFDTILFTSGVEYDEVLSWKKFNPKLLIGQFDYLDMDYYSIWSEYRTVCNDIYFEVTMPNKKIENVEWEKRESNIELSVIFPVYNVAKYLDKCLETVTAWKADYIEFLFINDGSPDNSADILREYSKKDSRVKVIDKVNGGCASARKLGLEKAQGKYIGLIDPDDFIEPDMFQQLHKRALLGSYQVAYCGYNEYYENTGEVKKVTQDSIYSPYTEGVRDEICIKKLIMYLRVAIWRGIYLKSMLNDNGITFNENFRRFDDLPFKIEVFSAAKSVVAIPEHMYYYRLERPGQDVACSDERLYVHFDIFKYLDEKQKIVQDSRTRDYLQMSKLQTHLYALEKIDNKYFNEYVKQMKKDMKHNMGIFRDYVITKAYLGNKSVLRKNLINLGFGKFIMKDKVVKRKQSKLAVQRSKTINELNKMY